jgi:hypothetical protein
MTMKSETKTPARAPTPEERRRLIAESAYLKAEQHGFQGNPEQDWLEAEAELERSRNGERPAA